MPLDSNSQSAKVGLAMNQNALSSSDSHERTLKPEEDKEEGEEGEEEEDEDADFNPFLKETPSQEASSSLSSEVDGLDGNVVTSGPSVVSELSKLTTKEQICTVVDTEHGEEEIVLQSSGMISQSEINQEKHNDLASAADGNGSRTGELNNRTKFQSAVMDIDNEDAICMRTRARYSLASFTLDELETFLQETDDDDDLQNADDEEEYKKFLAAVLQSGDGDGLSTHENENLDDDEDNDVDFEIELEELLESDAEDNAMVKTRKEYDGTGRRPETRQNKRQKVSAQCEKKTLEVKRPLRPILPNWLNGPLGSGKGLIPEPTLSFQSSASGNGLVNGFTPQQIGQLHCLIHEHVQLLIQVFSLSVLEPSQKQVASQVRGLLFEMLHKRDEILALKRVPYPSVCFTPSFARPSVSDGGSKLVQAQCNIEYVPPQDAQNVSFSQLNQSSSEGLNRQRSCLQATESSFWVPFVRGPVQSILDVSPLNLVRRYADDISSAAQEFRKRYIESGCDSPVEKEPLFPFSSSIAEATGEISSRTISRAVNAVSTSPGQQKPKKTLAAMLVESTKKQSIALVAKEVAKLAQRFLALFNPALFPHKPPPAAVVNRILFTDSEDELLALGIMEYNTDWKAIQQRFLPSKSKHQIFVRQKNRCSSKASENPIKAVRRMKTSPLTAEEIACIQEGLKIYKFDWMSVWQYIVPHRDPSLLPRQWRIALGTQKSYKIDSSKREKRRLYESKRRKLKAASWQAISDKEDCNADIAGSDVPYVHQAFLADWRPDTSTLTYSEHISTTSGEGNIAHNAFSQEDIQFYRGTHGYGLGGKAQHQNGNQSAFPSVSKLPQLFHSTSDLRNGKKGAPSAINPKKPVFDVTSSSKYYCRPYRSRRVHNAHLVKLAPDLPPVNLPPSVRVVSQTAFKGLQCGTSKVYPPGGGVAACRKDNSASQTPHGEKSENVHPVKGAIPALKDSVTGSQLERSETVEGRSIVAEKGTCTNLQMHPLLFQVTEDGNVPYYPLKFSSGTSSSFSFFSGSQPQLNLSLFHSSQQQSHIDCTNKSLKSKDSTLRSGGIDFHPLLQKSDDTQSPASFDAIQPESLVNSGVPAIANRSSGLNDKSNELDLEIHLSSVSGREKSVKSRHLKELDPVGSKKTVAISEIAMKPQEDSVRYCQQGVVNLSASSCELASSAPLVVPNDNIARYDVDDIGDQSHPEIVMEQEELSDSEEDIEEHVEFECEEMTDSEGEDGSGCEQALEIQNKEVIISSEENAVKYMASLKKPREPKANSDTQVGGDLLTNNTTLNIGLTSEGQNDRSSSSWLSLDSCTADNSVLSKAILQQSTIGEASASRKFSIGKAITEERHTIDMVQQPSIGPHVSTTPRKPRKRSGKSNAKLNIGLTVERSTCDVNHENG
ncbi:Myb protein O [Spatholobus suberectus]|nr:Myb protein O [Spatholobus suberectus]